MVASWRSRWNSVLSSSPRSSGLAVCLLALLASVCPFTAPAQRPLLTTADSRALARLLRVEDSRRDEPALVDSLLEHGRARLRARAALAAARIGARAHLAAIRLRTADQDDSVQATAWFALALLRDSASVPAAAAQLHAPPPVASQAVRLLGEVGEVGRAAIVSGLADSTLPSAVRGELLLVASRLRPLPLTALLPLVSSTDSALAWRAAYALARGRSPSGVRSLLARAFSPVGALREQVARGLSRAVAGDSLGDSALVVLRKLAVDPDARVRVNAVRALSTYGSRARTPVMSGVHDDDAGARVAAAQSLAAVLDSSADSWSAAFAADTALVFQAAVLEGAAARGVMLPALQTWRISPDWRRRASVVVGQSRGAADSAVARVAGWLRDPDARVRTTAATALAALMDSATAQDAAREQLRHALEDPDTFVRAEALGGLSSRASTADLELALTEYSRSAADRDSDARLAFWRLADSTVLHAGATLPDSTSRRLAALARPSDPLERIAAARIPRFAAWADPTGTARPLTWYEARAREVSYHPQRVARIETSRGRMTLVLYAWDAPLTVYNFATLAERHYFDGQRFHRVVPNFVIQAGDPRGDGNGGPDYAIRDEINAHRYGRGALGMALSGPDTGGSQFFITHSPQPHLDGGYTVFGQLLSGYDTLDRVVQGDRIVRVTIR